ncbi:hypothetical protein PTNB85_01334 [Pyrenophora teres f. teres]|nr:hypothetical protein HRS9139_01311 [Pyrenophora teres f. teres]KAE8850918.1 hypothetical protein PTNB85_01334 [Pyrenophora teres f. teres]KAE8869723.1 hypothetical protein PTNB29_00067 [Pyrenophora teres f. teres]
MGKRKPHRAGRPQKTLPTEEDQTDGTIYFYMPNEPPYGVFCQWHASPFNIPTSSLQWLVETAPTPPRPSETPTPASTKAKEATPLTAQQILSTHATPIPFTTAEQSYMYLKSLYFSHSPTCTRILSTTDPKLCKKLGSSVPNFSAYHWDRVKQRVARVVNWYKFTDPRNAAMKAVLLGTGERELAEASPRDRVWGIGFRKEKAEGRRAEWGENLLGRVVVGVRGRVRGWERKERGGEVVGWEWDGEVEGEDDGDGEEEAEVEVEI